MHRRSEHLDLDHYLEVLWRRPGALPSATALAQARESGRFRPEHQQFWDLARRRHGDSAGTRALCDVLLLHRHHHNDHVVSGIRAALSIDSVDDHQRCHKFAPLFIWDADDGHLAHGRV